MSARWHLKYIAVVPITDPGERCTFSVKLCVKFCHCIMTFIVYLKSNKRSLVDAILNILGIVSISDLVDYTQIADLSMNVHPEFNSFIMN